VTNGDFKRAVKCLIPFRYYSPVSSIYVRLQNFGLNRYCPVCRTHLRSFTSYDAGRIECECPVCRSLERHRLAWLFFTRKTNLFDGVPKKFLHIAPEWTFVEVFSRMRFLKYITADIASPLAMVHLDVTALPFTDKYFDVIFCSHVLEHVPNDQTAMREFYRVLKPGGWFLPDVPVLRDTTFEDPSITGSEERERVFGQSDHVRIYGRDFKGRLENAGFQVRLDPLAHELGEAGRRMNGVDDCDLYFCTKARL
jgi:predicted SAM-dependent methyltransferase